MLSKTLRLSSSRILFNSFCKSFSDAVILFCIFIYTPVSEILTISASIVVPADRFSVNLSKLLSIYCLIPREILSLSESIPKIAALVSMSRSSDLENFSKSALALKDSGIEGDINVEEISSKVKEAAQELSKSEEFKKQAEAQGAPADETKILQSAEKAAFQQMKSDFDKKVNQTIQSLKQQALEEIENLSPDEQNTSVIKQTKLGIKLLKLIEDAKLSIQNA